MNNITWHDFTVPSLWWLNRIHKVSKENVVVISSHTTISVQKLNNVWTQLLCVCSALIPRTPKRDFLGNSYILDHKPCKLGDMKSCHVILFIFVIVSSIISEIDANTKTSHNSHLLKPRKRMLNGKGKSGEHSNNRTNRISQEEKEKRKGEGGKNEEEYRITNSNFFTWWNFNHF